MTAGKLASCDKSTPHELLVTLQPLPVSMMAGDVVSTMVNRSRYDGPECLGPQE
jgi:hypothetical protein